MDADLARGLQSLLDFDEGAGAIEEVFGVTFTASENPLLSNELHTNVQNASRNVSPRTPRKREYQEDDEDEDDSNGHVKMEVIAPRKETQFVDLHDSGAEKYVDRVNRSDFVKRFIHHALYACCKKQIDDYISGLRFLFDGPAVKLCTHNEVICACALHCLLSSTELVSSTHIPDIVLRLYCSWSTFYVDRETSAICRNCG